MTPSKLSWCAFGMLVGALGLGSARAELPPAAAEEIEGILQNAVTNGRVASVTAQVRQGGQVVFSDSAGYADLEQGVKATPEGMYPIGSITKSITAYCIFTLVNQGKLKLSDRLADILPNYTGSGGQATILQLLTHTSGIHDYAGDSAPDLIGDPTRLFSEDQVVALFAKHPSDFVPGEHWQYSNSGYFLLGLVIEKVTGRPYNEVAHDLLFAPFGLSHILMDYRQPLMKNRVRNYTHGDDGSFQNSPVYDATVALAAGGYRSTVGDLTRYIETLFSLKVPQAIHDMMLTPMKLNGGTVISYRPSALVASDLQGHPIYSHAGGIWGAHAFISYMPADQVAIGLFTNTDDGSVDLADLDRKIARIVLNIPRPVVRDVPLARREGESSAGTYCLQELEMTGSEVTVSYDGKSLSLTRKIAGAAPRVTSLHHQGKGLFVPDDDEDATIRFPVGRKGTKDIQMDSSPRGSLFGLRCRQ